MCAITDFESVQKNNLKRISKKMRRGMASDGDQCEAIALLLDMSQATMTELKKVRHSVGDMEQRLWPEEVLEKRMGAVAAERCANCTKGDWAGRLIQWVIERFRKL